MPRFIICCLFLFACGASAQDKYIGLYTGVEPADTTTHPWKVRWRDAGWKANIKLNLKADHTFTCNIYATQHDTIKPGLDGFISSADSGRWFVHKGFLYICNIKSDTCWYNDSLKQWIWYSKAEDMPFGQHLGLDSLVSKKRLEKMQRKRNQINTLNVCGVLTKREVYYTIFYLKQNNKGQLCMTNIFIGTDFWEDLWNGHYGGNTLLVKQK